MAEANPAELAALIDSVEDPVLFAPLGALGIVSGFEAMPDSIRLTVRVPPDYRERGELERRVEAATRHVRGARSVVFAAVDMVDKEVDELGEVLHSLGSGQKGGAGQIAGRVLSIASGKGGVGKSTVTVNLAVALAKLGHTVGLLDADVYGFSVPRMIGAPRPPLVVGRTVVPVVANGVRCVSMGFFVDESKPVAWRGPMLHKALERFVYEVHWARPDFLVVDMPPGTGDVALSVAEHLPGAEIYVVTTPQRAAERVAQRAGALGRELRIPVRGVIENMSTYTSPSGERIELFGSGGGAVLAATLGVDLLASIPFDPAVLAGADDGEPASSVDEQGTVASAFMELGRRVVELGAARIFRSELRIS